MNQSEVSSSKIRVTVVVPLEQQKELRLLVLVRQLLAVRLPDFHADDARHDTHRDGDGRPYFEFSTKMPSRAIEAIREHRDNSMLRVVEVP